MRWTRDPSCSAVPFLYFQLRIDAFDGVYISAKTADGLAYIQAILCHLPVYPVIVHCLVWLSLEINHDHGETFTSTDHPQSQSTDCLALNLLGSSLDERCIWDVGLAGSADLFSDNVPAFSS